VVQLQFGEQGPPLSEPEDIVLMAATRRTNPILSAQRPVFV
jgi:hypothetical protein